MTINKVVILISSLFSFLLTRLSLFFLYGLRQALHQSADLGDLDDQ